MSKYLNQKITIDGRKFDSKKEANRYLVLKDLESRGAISGLSMQVPFVLIDKSQYGRAIKYIADFVYIEGFEMVVEDVKSNYTRKNPLYRLKKRLMAERYKIKIREV